MASPPIYALSSGSTPSGVAVIRLSGANSLEIARLLCGGKLPKPREARVRTLKRPADGAPLDSALVIPFPGPASFTGEDSVEFHCHGSSAVVSAVLDALKILGARPAEAGEFTRRAFESGRLDLTQAEALSDLIVAETEAQRELALAGAGGRLREKADSWRDRLMMIMAEIEADLDFSDEGDVAADLALQVKANLSALIAEMEAALSGVGIAERIRHGLTIAVIGPPNAGKSSLVNALARRDVAIVTPHAGTTRDVLEVHLNLGGMAAVLLDTAGLRETHDPIEAEGIRRALERAGRADLVLDLGPDGNLVNKIDETDAKPGWRESRLYLSAKSGAGLDLLEAWLIDWASQQAPSGEPPLITTARQQALLEDGVQALKEGEKQSDPVLLAESMRVAAHSLGRITGRIDAESILGTIFGRFCIGK